MIGHVFVQYSGPKTCNEVHWLGAGDWSKTTNERSERADPHEMCACAFVCNVARALMSTRASSALPRAALESSEH